MKADSKSPPVHSPHCERHQDSQGYVNTTLVKDMAELKGKNPPRTSRSVKVQK